MHVVEVGEWIHSFLIKKYLQIFMLMGPLAKPVLILY